MQPDERRLFDWAMSQNLNDIVRFQNFVRSQLAEYFRAKPEGGHERTVLANYDNYLATNAFLMAYAYLEEYLLLIWKQLAKSTKPTNGHSILRYEPVLRKLGVDLKHPSWIFLRKATLVRHCLLHANGRISFMKTTPPQQFRSIARSFPDGLAIRNTDRLVVKVHFTSRMVDAIREFQGLVPK